jgi:hypothetical protein
MTDPPIHYLVANSNGESLIIEFIEKEMKIFQSADYGIITNFLITGLDLPADSPCTRYDIVYSGIMENDVLSKDLIFGLLEDSSQENTIWSCVYDIRNLSVHIVMGKHYEKVYTLYLEP